MSREEVIGNVTTIGKILLCTFGTPAIVNFANSNEFVLVVSALCGLLWAFYDSKYFNTFFNRSSDGEIPDHDGAAEYEDVWNGEYSVGDDDGC